jgi:hypothetical protein
MTHDQEDGRDTVFVWSGSDIRRTSERRPAPRAKAPCGGEVSASSIDHRRYPRLDLKLPILYRVMGHGPSRLPAAVRPALLAQSRDVSPLGLCLSLEELLQPGEVLSLSIHMVEEREKFDALARVVWSRPAAEPGHFLTGLQFVVVDGRRVKESLHLRMEALIRRLESHPA